MQAEIQRIISHFEMLEHPEGGFYKELFRSSNTAKNRSVLSSIHYLLYDNHVSNFHTIDADEAWYHHEGGVLNVHTFHPEKGYQLLRLGSISDGAEPFQIVEAGTIFGSCLENENSYVLVSCAVAPAFEFEHFYLNERSDLLAKFPEQEKIIFKLTREVSR
jgi:predicted cupin superfamily sugar epimerase